MNAIEKREALAAVHLLERLDFLSRRRADELRAMIRFSEVEEEMDQDNILDSNHAS